MGDVGSAWGSTEKAAVERDPSWERQEHQSVREYLQSLAERLPLDRVAVDVYADLYEKARFSEEELTLDEYSVAMNAFVTLMQVYVGSRHRRQRTAPPLTGHTVRAQAPPRPAPSQVCAGGRYLRLARRTDAKS